MLCLSGCPVISNKELESIIIITAAVLLHGSYLVDMSVFWKTIVQ